jgi:hypothetical protein
VHPNADVDRLLEAASHARPDPASLPAAFLIYGAGGRGREVRRVLERRGHRVVGFIDQAGRPGLDLAGLPVWSPDAAEARAANAAGAHVAIAIFRHDADIAQIAASLTARGFRNVVSFLNVYRHYPDDFPGTYWLGPAQLLAASADAIRRAFGLLGDAQSRRVFVECLKMRVEADVSVLRAPDRSSQYIPSDVVTLTTPQRWVDGGAFDGDTVRALRAAEVPLSAVAAFEPDPVNYAKLVATAGADPLVDYALFPCGLWSSSTQLRFQADGSDGARIGSEGASVIQCVALDACLPTFRPTFIKLDVEGAEPEALIGGRQTITSHRPTLAVSAYHQPDHLWSLIHAIDALEVGYRFELRHHGFLHFDVVLYALPT